MKKYFGTDGFRGEVNVDLKANDAFRIGRFLGWYYKGLKQQAGSAESAKIVIGKDTRRSSYMIENSLAAGIVSSGADVYIMHVTTTPSICYITRVDDFDCGIMISASHNPYYDNGIKLVNRKGEKMEEKVILKIEEYLDGKFEIPLATRADLGAVIDYVAGRNRYTAYLISIGLYSFKGIRVGLDCANGSAWAIAKNVFDAFGASTYLINAQPNGYNINLNSGSTHLESLQKLVIDNKLDVGFAYDGDADRCLAVDENGQILTGDHIMYICARHMKEKNLLANDMVVTTIMSNLGLYKSFDELGIKYVKVPVGDKNVYEHIKKHHDSFGGEQSGHIIFPKYATTGDGILTSLKLMEVMLAKKTTLSILTSQFKVYPQTLINVKVQDKATVLNDEDVKNSIKKVEEALGTTGRILVRGSGTEPLIRVMVEAETQKECNKYCNQVVNLIKRKGYEIE